MSLVNNNTIVVAHKCTIIKQMIRSNNGSSPGQVNDEMKIIYKSMSKIKQQTHGWTQYWARTLNINDHQLLQMHFLCAKWSQSWCLLAWPTPKLQLILFEIFSDDKALKKMRKE